MDNGHEHRGHGFFNGFLLGAIVGAAVVFFLFTDKGKKLLKTIMEEGGEGFSELKDLIKEEIDEEELLEEEEEPVHHLSTIAQKPEHSHVEPLVHTSHEAHPHETHHTSHKRFFKGAKRG